MKLNIWKQSIHKPKQCFLNPAATVAKQNDNQTYQNRDGNVRWSRTLSYTLRYKSATPAGLIENRSNKDCHENQFQKVCNRNWYIGK